MRHSNWLRRVSRIRRSTIDSENCTKFSVKEAQMMGKKDCHTGNPCELLNNPTAQIQDQKKILKDQASITAYKQQYGYGKNHKEMAKTGQERTRDCEECSKAGSEDISVHKRKSQRLKPCKIQGPILPFLKVH
nr:hypothetical protein [Tanacetum cinerariifolium]